MTQHLETHILSKFKIVKKIGSGAYGHVWKVIDNKDKKVKALKKNFDAFNNSTDAQRTYRQIMFLMELKHPNIVKLEQVIRADNNNDIYLVFQHMDIDLFTLIRQGILQERHKKWVLYQIAKSIYYLHSAGLIHRDLKPSNILVNENCDAKLCDFGLVRSLDDGQDQSDNILTEYIATRWYRAPEILVGSTKYTKSIDIWGLGCLIGQMFKGKPLFPGTSTINQMERVLAWTGIPKESELRALKSASATQIIKTALKNLKKLNKAQFVPHASDLAMDLLAKTMQFDPQKRITIQQVLKHPYLKEFYKKSDLVTETRKIKVSIDDNQRLSLKQYRNLIYKEIKLKDNQSDRRESVDKTLYRIRQTSTKKHLASLGSQQTNLPPPSSTNSSYPLQPQQYQKHNNQQPHYNPQQSPYHQQVHKKLSANNAIVSTVNSNSNFRNATETTSAPKNITQNGSSKGSSHLNSSNFPSKKKSHSIAQKSDNPNRHLRTVQKQWNPSLIETKKATNFKQQVRRTKTLISSKPKRSIYEVETKKASKRLIPSKNSFYNKQQQHHQNQQVER